MKMKDIRQKNDKDLREELVKKRDALREFRFGITGSRSRNPKAGQELRRDTARILTELNMRRKQQ